MSGLAFTFTDTERAYLSEMRALTTDSQGREHLVGLTLDETALYMRCVRDRSRKGSREDTKRFVQLHDKHELARLQVIGAEVVLRQDKPTRH